MKPILCLLAVLAGLVFSGCQFMGSTAEATAIGHPIQEILEAQSGAKIEYFDARGRKLAQLPVGQDGSVSVFLPEEAGQDNYSVDPDGKVTRHQRSYGDNYLKGVWEEVK
jgi:hypothetical protein